MAVLQYRTLSNRTIATLSVERDTVFWDRELTGFGVRVYPSGGKVFVAQARGPDGPDKPNKPRRITVARHPVLSAEQARQRAALIIARVKAGEDPVPLPLPAKYAGGPTVTDLANRYLEEHVAVRCKPKTQRTAGWVGATPATRGEIIAGLKKQGFLAAQGKNIVPTERGLALFAILDRADPALVDAGVTAELECLLDDVLIGRQKMMGAIDAVCGSAGRIIARLTERAVEGEQIGAEVCVSGDADRPPTSAMRKFAASIAKRKGIKPPAGYTKSAAVCRGFLDEHAPERHRRPDSSTPIREAKARKSSNGAQARKRSGPKSAKPRRAAKPDRGDAGTPLRIPYGNKEVAFSLGARYGANGWYAPQGIDLTGFRERGWL